MKMSFLKIGLVGATAFLMTACGGGGGGGGDNPAPVNKAPVANAGSDENAFGAKKVTLDASGSYDDGSIVEYVWKEGNTVLGTGAQLPYLFVDGEHTITLTVKDNAGLEDTDSLTVTAKCMMAESISISKNVNGSVNIKGNQDSCYKVQLTSNNGIEEYAFYTNLLTGTKLVSVKGYAYTTIYDETQTPLSGYENKSIGKAIDGGKRFTVTIPTDGAYYIVFHRQFNYETYYAFSLEPSLANGLVQDPATRELNDELYMASPIDSISDAQAGIEGSLNATRDGIESKKNSDTTDYYSIELQKGLYEIKTELLTGTQVASIKGYAYITIYNDSGDKLPGFDDKIIGRSVGAQATLELNIPSDGTYAIRFHRQFKYKTHYQFSLVTK